MSKPKTQVKIICKICKKEFWIHNYRKNTAKYCSYKCQYASLKGHPPNKTSFKKGHKSWNKGNHIYLGGKRFEKGIHASPKTEFKKGEHMGENHPFWKGGKRTNGSGYVLIYSPNHPFANKNYVLNSRLISEQYLGRYLEPSEIVHHIDLNPLNDQPENLFIFKSQGYHCIFHRYLNKNPILKDFLESNLF